MSSDAPSVPPKDRRSRVLRRVLDFFTPVGRDWRGSRWIGNKRKNGGNPTESSPPGEAGPPGRSQKIEEAGQEKP